jgi:hypothetical protein
MKYSDVIKNLCINTLIRAIYVCVVLCVVTSVITPRKDPGYDLKYPNSKIEIYNVFNVPIPGSIIGTTHYTDGSKSCKHD